MIGLVLRILAAACLSLAWLAPSVAERFRRDDDRFSLTSTPTNWPLLLAAWFDTYGWFVLAGALAYFGYRLSRPGAAEVLKRDQRPPVLYLRAFTDDLSNNLNPRGILAWLLGIFRPWGLWKLLAPLTNLNPLRLWKLVFGQAFDTSEEQLATFFSLIGPFITIGNPGERARLGGAYRVYLNNDEWQGWVLEQMDRAQCVVLQPAETQGVWWEVLQVASRLDKRKLVISLLAFHNFRRRSFRLDAWRFEQARWDQFRARAQTLFPRGLPERPGKAQFICFDTNGEARLVEPRLRSPFLWPFVGVAADLPGMFESFADRLIEPAKPLELAPRRLRPLGQLAAAACLLSPLFYITYFAMQPEHAFPDSERMVLVLPSDEIRPSWRASRVAASSPSRASFQAAEDSENMTDFLARHQSRSQSPLHAALQDGSLPEVKRLLDAGEPIEGEGPFGGTPLMEALRRNQLDIAQLLLDRGANINATTENGWTPLNSAAHSMATFQWALDHGAQLRSNQLETLLAAAIAQADPGVLRTVLDRGADPNHPLAASTGRTPLHVAAAMGNFEVVKLLLDRGADPSVKDADGVTPLQLAQERKQAETATLLRSASVPSRAATRAASTAATTPLRRTLAATRPRRTASPTTAAHAVKGDEPCARGGGADDGKLDALAARNWELYRAKKFAGSFNGGQYTDSDLTTKGKEMWCNGRSAKLSHRINGYFECIYVVRDGQLHFAGTLSNKGRFAITAKGFETLIGHPQEKVEEFAR